MNLIHECLFEYFSEDELQLIEQLMDLLPGNSSRNLDVVMKVLLPETLIKMFMDIKNLSYQEAEEQLLEGDFPEEQEGLFGEKREM